MADSILGNGEAFACFECTYLNLMYNTNESTRSHWLHSIPTTGSKHLDFREDLTVLRGEEMLWPYRFILPLSLNKSSSL